VDGVHPHAEGFAILGPVAKDAVAIALKKKH